MPARYIGAHIPASGGLAKALRRGKDIGCTAVQVFTSSPRQWKAVPPTTDMIAEFDRARTETGIDHIVTHDTYLVNLCAPDEEVRRKSFVSLVEELRRSADYGIPLVVSHMGSSAGQELPLALGRTAQAALEVLAETPDSVTLLMETTAGQGSSLNFRFEQIAAILDFCKRPPRLQVCIDTCHLFAAGYDLRTPEAYEATFAEFDRIVGVGTIRAIHANDSKKGLGSRVDRHEHIGKGEIGRECFRLLVNDPRFEEVPIVIETPEEETMHEENVRLLWSLVEPYE
ncbi:MAG TPA: deoxyribonuclease IV [Fimbriimonadaceae bacterium]|nr:deoxyribonuclease IV [Fimbriimonadaceae bacterium]HRJ96389.1 deoxyribonuclease IV [Fimbriimonadaceae bacterium]